MTASAPLAPAQRRAWTLHTAGVAPCVQIAFAVPDGIDRAQITKSLDAAASRHESLRTLVRPEPLLDFPLQEIHDEPPSHVCVQSLVADAATALDDAALAPLRAAINPGSSPLVVGVIERGERSFLVLTGSALIHDAASLFWVGDAILNPSRSDQDDDVVQLREVVQWQNDLIASADAEPGRRFWQQQVTRADRTWTLPRARADQADPSFRLAGAATHIAIDVQILTEAVTAANAIGIGREAFLLGCWHALLWHATRTEIGTIGVAASLRSDPLLERVVGPLTACVPCVLEARPARSLRQHLSLAVEALEAVSGWAECFEPTLGRRDVAPAFDVTFDWHDLTAVSSPNAPTVEALLVRSEPAALQLSVVQQGDRMAAVITIGPQISRGWADRLTGRLRMLVKAALDRPDTPLARLDLLTPDERRWLQEAAADPEVPHPPTLLHVPFEEMAARAGERIAVRSGSVTLTYAELNDRAGALAHELRAIGVGQDAAVGLLLDRSIELVTAMLAVLKAGAAYVPLDPNLPPARVADMLEQAAVRVVIASRDLRERMADVLAASTVLDPATDVDPSHQLDSTDVEALPGNVAYVLFTSGSTGRPKGVQIEHRAIGNHMCWMRRTVPLAPDDRVLQRTVTGFDASVWEFHLPLWSGAEIVIGRPEASIDADALLDDVAQHGVTVVQVVPTMLRMMVGAGRPERGRTLRCVFVGGEALDPSLVAAFTTQFPDAELVNLYGPTEATVDATSHTFARGARPAVVPVGRPIDNVRAYVLDAALQPAPLLTAGELYLAGAGLARGYVRRPDLTADRFVPDPFGAPGSRMYRTGDVARWNADADLEVLGRVDRQVKVRGYRIELGEIASVLERLPDVAQAVVKVDAGTGADVAAGADRMRLVAYLQSRSADRPTIDRLREHLRRHVPEYMVPQAFVYLDRFPLTASGKVDWGRLPRAAGEQADGNRPYEAPRTAVEQSIASIWRQLLRLERVGRQDNFFDLGGHSLLLTQAVARMRQLLGVPVPLLTVMRHPTVAALAAAIERQPKPATPAAGDRAQSPLVSIRDGGVEPPLFLAHPVGGGVGAYLELASRLRSDCPVHAFRAPGPFDPSDWADAPSIEALAAKYLACVDRAALRKGCVVGGWSYGGVLAFAIAEQMLAANVTVYGVLLFDTWPPGPRVSIADDVVLVLGLARQLAAQARAPFPLTWQDLDPLDERARIDRVIATLHETGLLPGLTRRAVERMLLAYRERTRHADRYLPAPLPIPLTLFRVPPFDPDIRRAIHPSVVDDPMRGWTAFSTRPVRVIDVPGTHWTLFEEPQVSVLAGLVDAEVQALVGDAARSSLV